MTILFYPDNLNSDCRLFPICNELGIKFHNDPNEPYDVAIYWSYHKTIRVPDDFIRNHPKMANKGCWDITKTKVEYKFGTNLIVHPRYTSGWAVEKSQNQNAHDGVLVECPCEPKPGKIYQRYIDTKVLNKNHHVDYRAFVSNGKVDFVLAKKKHSPFKSDVFEVELMGPQVLDLSTEQIIAGAKRFGLDFGELDILFEGFIPHVIDVNNVSGNGLSHHKEFMDRYKKHFEDFISSWQNNNTNCKIV